MEHSVLCVEPGTLKTRTMEGHVRGLKICEPHQMCEIRDFENNISRDHVCGLKGQCSLPMCETRGF